MKNLRLSILALAISACAFAQGLVTIQAVPPITRADGSLANGTMSVSWQAFTTADGTPVAPGAKNVSISSGVFTTAVQLYPNVGATPPGTSYLVQYNLSGSPVFQRRWYIPASNIPIDVVAVEFPIQGLVGITAIVSPAQLTQAGASVNQPLCWNGAFWGPGSCGGGSFSLPGSNGSLLYRASSSSFGAVGLGTTTTLLHGNAAGAPTYGQVVTGDIGAGAVNLTTQVSGILPPANGGSGTSNVFTQGSVLFAGTAGITQQDNANFFWDQASHRLGIGTASPNAMVDIHEVSGVNTAINLQGAAGAAGQLRIVDGNLTNVWFISADTNGRLNFFDGTASYGALSITPTTDNILIGSNFGSDGLFRLDVQSSSFSGTARFFDQTTSGMTQVVIQGGAAQSGNDLVTINNNSSVAIAGITGDGSVFTSRNLVSIPNLSSGSGASLNAAYSNGLAFSNNKFITWSSTGNWFDAADTALAKVSAGIIELTNSVAGQRYGTQIQVGSGLFYDNTPTTGVTQLALRNGAGQGGNSVISARNNAGSILFAVGSGGDVNVFDTSGNDKGQLNATGEVLTSDVSIGFTNGTSLNSSTIDAGISRISAGLVGIGNGTPGSFSGSLKASSATLTSLANSGCVQANSSGLLTGTGSPCGGEYLNSTYNFTPQTPGGTLTASSPSTITLTGCPFGVAGADTNHYLYVSGGTGTAEAVLVTGGSCTSGAGSGTVSFTPANNHSGAWTVASATGGIQEAINVAAGTAVGAQVGLSGNITTFAPVTISTSNISVVGHGAVMSLTFPSGTSYSGIQLLGGQGVTTTSTTLLTLANRSLTSADTINVASATGFVVGDLVQLAYNDSTYVFVENTNLIGISSNTLTFSDPIVIPLQTSLTGNVRKMLPLNNVSIRDLYVDCTPTNSSAVFVRGLFISIVEMSRFENITFNGCSQGSGQNSGGLFSSTGYGNQYHHINAINSGSLNVNALAISSETSASISDLVSEGNQNATSDSFGIGFAWISLSNLSNITASGSNSRAVKVASSGWNNFSNIQANNSAIANGFSLTVGSYRNTVNGVSAVFNHGSPGSAQGIWLNGQDNEYNVINGIRSFGNNPDIQWFSTDTNNIFRGQFGTYATAGNAQSDPGTNNRIEIDGSVLSSASMACSGTATASQATIYVSQNGGGACTSTGPTSQTVSVLMPTSGIIRNLRVSAGTGGVNASSGVVTINIIGVGASAITCTLGTGTTCSDLTHFYIAPAGTSVNVSFSTQGSETMANVLVTFEY